MAAKSKTTYLEFKDDRSHKFWEITLKGKSHTVRFGKVGSAGQNREKNFGSAEKASQSCEKLIAEKKKKGYKPKKAGPKNKSVAKKPTSSKPPKVAASVNTSKIWFKIEYEGLKSRGKWSVGTLEANYLELGEAGFKKLYAKQKKAKSQTGTGVPLIHENHGKLGDFAYFPHSEKFALSEKAWEHLKPLLPKHIKVVRGTVTHETKPDSYSFSKVPKSKQTSWYLVDQIPILKTKKTQTIHWDDRRHCFQYAGEKRTPEIRFSELKGLVLFGMNSEWHQFVTPSFVEAVKKHRLKGLSFYPVEFEDFSKPVFPPPKKQLNAWGAFPGKVSSGKWNQSVPKTWESIWNWTTGALQNRQWPARKFKKSKPVSKKRLSDFEEAHELKLPPIFRSVMEKYSAKVTICNGFGKTSLQQDQAYEVEQKVAEGRIGLFDDQVIWDFNEVECGTDNGFDLMELKEISRKAANVAPFTTLPNGDFLTVHLVSEEIRYWSHDGDSSLDRPLGKNLIDFITRLSWLGVPRIDFLPETPFYNQKKKSLVTTQTQPVKAWHSWLEGKEI